jgi:hypothetical protein
METQDPAWAEIMDVAGQDPARAVVLSLSLRRLATGASGELLAEMAQAVLSGQVSLRQAAASQVYGDAFAKGFSRFWARYERMTESERRRAIEKGNAQLRQIRARLAARGIKPNLPNDASQR